MKVSLVAASLLALALLLLSIPFARAVEPLPAGGPAQLEPGVFDIPVLVSSPQDGRREEYRRMFWGAQRSLRAFAKANGWESLTDKPFVKQVEIFDSKPAFDSRLRELSNLDQSQPILKTFSATIEKDIFVAVSPETYLDNYPQGNTPHAYEKLMEHELAHRLHVRILDGNDDLMGPMWFYEGFATYVSDQFPGNKPLAEPELWQIVAAKERGSYRKYNAAFTQLLDRTKVSLAEYVRRAGQPGFIDWLKNNSARVQ